MPPNTARGVFANAHGRRLIQPIDGSRRGVFSSVPDVIDAIRTWVEHGNADPKPLISHSEAEDIIAKVPAVPH